MHIEAIEHEGYTINIHQDTDAANPWVDWDGNPPLLVYSGDRAMQKHGDFEYPAELSLEQIRAHLPDILGCLGYAQSWGGLLKLARDYSATAHDLADTINDAINEQTHGCSGHEHMELVRAAFRWHGIVAVEGYVHGHAQSSWSYVLAVATPEWLTYTDADAEQVTPSLEAAIELYGDWAFGNVYGYVITDSDGEEIEDGSCWGFFGDYGTPFGAVHEAEAAINWHISEQREAHQARLKAMIKHGAPLEARA